MPEHYGVRGIGDDGPVPPVRAPEPHCEWQNSRCTFSVFRASNGVWIQTALFSIITNNVTSVENHILPSVVPQIGGPNAVVVSTGGGWVVLLHHRLWTAFDGARGSEVEKLVLGGDTRP